MEVYVIYIKRIIKKKDSNQEIGIMIYALWAGKERNVKKLLYCRFDLFFRRHPRRRILISGISRRWLLFDS